MTSKRKTRPMSSPSILAALALAGTMGLTSCKQAATGEAGAEAGRSIEGRVLDVETGPMPGVVVRSSRMGQLDTTDASGRYHLRMAAPTDGDSLVFFLKNLPVASLRVGEGAGSLPDVQLLKRTFSGQFASLAGEIARVEGTLHGTAFGPGGAATSGFFLDRAAGAYSGYFFCPVEGGESLYSVVVDVYDARNVLMGTSDTLRFDGLAGDLELPPFDPMNRRLRVEATFSDSLELRVREAAPGDTLFLGARAYPPRGARVTSWAWDSGDGTFRPSGGSLRFVVPPSHGAEIRLILRIATDAGQSAEDTLRVKVLTRFEHMLRRPWRTLGQYHGQEFEMFRFPLRYHHGLVVHRDRILALGGQGYGQDTLRDVLSTVDGAAWTRVAEDAPASVRWLASAMVRGDTLWLPGSNARTREVWFSTDGATWTLATDSAAYPPRIRPSTAVFGGKLWVVGGVDSLGQTMNDVWASEDGRTWTRKAEIWAFHGYSEPVWSPASSLGATADALFLLTPGRPGILYSTTTGATWKSVHTDSLFAEAMRRGAGTGALIGFGDQLLLVGTSGMNVYDLVARRWRSDLAGLTDLTTVFSRAAYDYREGAGIVRFRDRIWLTGGKAVVGSGVRGSGIKIYEDVLTLEW